VTALVIVGGLLAWLMYDVLAYAIRGNDATISVRLWRTSVRYRGFAIVLAFLAGVLFGHLFLPQHVLVTP
jgi:hypothetical protein